LVFSYVSRCYVNIILYVTTRCNKKTPIKAYLRIFIVTVTYLFKEVRDQTLHMNFRAGLVRKVYINMWV
ncbi:MAG: hypothetical protein SFT93_03715, partial [Rickettsiaceae bacterium]|nr:hypothetical protein [Rickettsiaceae bacterium]